jgi:ribosomal protein uS17
VSEALGACDGTIGFRGLEISRSWHSRTGRSAWEDGLNNYLHGHADKKCPFTGLVSIRGRILTGTVVSTKMHRTLVIRREYLHFIPKYSRYERRHKNLSAHVSPAFRVEEGDKVTVGQCRPLSKTVC